MPGLRGGAVTPSPSPGLQGCWGQGRHTRQLRRAVLDTATHTVTLTVPSRDTEGSVCTPVGKPGARPKASRHSLHRLPFLEISDRPALERRVATL